MYVDVEAVGARFRSDMNKPLDHEGGELLQILSVSDSMCPHLWTTAPVVYLHLKIKS